MVARAPNFPAESQFASFQEDCSESHSSQLAAFQSSEVCFASFAMYRILFSLPMSVFLEILTLKIRLAYCNASLIAMMTQSAAATCIHHCFHLM